MLGDVVAEDLEGLAPERVELPAAKREDVLDDEGARLGDLGAVDDRPGRRPHGVVVGAPLRL